MHAQNLSTPTVGAPQARHADYARPARACITWSHGDRYRNARVRLRPVAPQRLTAGTGTKDNVASPLPPGLGAGSLPPNGREPEGGPGLGLGAAFVHHP